jgi:transposase
MDGYWQAAPMPRNQIPLIDVTLDARIPEDHQVRLLDEILGKVEWAEWEARYHGRRGQPPIHPRVMCAVLLYGLMRRARSSREIEYLIAHNVDFMWLAHGRTIDHTTLSEFRRKHEKELKQLYRNVCHIAAAMGLLRLADVAVDGTRVRANANRYKTVTAEKVEALLEQLRGELEQALATMELEDTANDLLLDADESTDRLPPDLANAKQRMAQLEEMLKQLQETERTRRRDGVDVTKNPAQIPITDPDSRIMPNKEGGYAANYTPMVVTDVQSGFIVSATVIASPAEQNALIELLADVEETFGVRPSGVLGDGVYATAENLVETDELGVELISPPPGPDAAADNPAIRDDPTQPVAPEDRERLPINSQTQKLDKAAFIYDEEEDRYWCPDGRSLEFEETKTDTRRGRRTQRRTYRSTDCSGCPLIDKCIRPRNKKGRTVSRDVHEKRRQEHAKKMATDEAKARYARRFHAAEVPFAILKQILNLRRFLLRGLRGVQTEWLWACTAFNLKKLIKAVAQVRADSAETAVTGVN